MGTEISLDIGGMSVAWSKNHRGMDHGFLFQSADQRCVPDDEDDDPSEDDDPDQVLMDMTFIRTLRSALPRLELLGHTLAVVKADYERVARESIEERRIFQGDGIEIDLPLELMAFEEFLAFATKFSVRDLSDSYDDDLHADWEKRLNDRHADDSAVGRVPSVSSYDVDGYSERSYFGSLIGFLNPYNILRLLAENERNLDCNLEWRYGPLVSNGWANVSEFVPEARRTQTFLISTEGSSDIHIIRHAIDLLRPEIADFFRFIDVSEGHPFSGAGNLVRFAQGLAKIDVHNQTLFLLDNDAEGVSAHKRISALSLPENMRTATLPEMERFRKFRTRGPEGVGAADINGRAVAIECYLDLTAEATAPAEVAWTSYNKELDVYQGELLNKGAYTKTFLKHAASIKGYDMSGVAAVLDMIYSECCKIAETAQVNSQYS
ncbi:MAG: hypothetical protein B7X53_02020 [Hyphomonas sp. 34-62-18]|nr:HEPN/Toprim-associated domain-containing protein [Hyphomonas sp. 34-62-18]OZB18870.1 MAG: hypothetical protein B7X53_02020 [Hyphomonas sp. 34-62-18]